jgi:hypothetical protein
VRVEGAAATGEVKVTLAFDDWQAGKVAPATYVLPLPPKPDRREAAPNR